MTDKIMVAEAHSRTSKKNTSTSQTLYDRAQTVMPGGNTRDTVFFKPYPLYASRGAGCRVVDVDGVERIDFINNYSALIHGHCNREINDAVIRQLNTLPAVGMPTEGEVLLADLLCSQVPSVERVRFTNSGTEAVMMALKAARCFTGKHKIAKVEGAYHGSYDWVDVSVAPRSDEWGPRDRPTSVPRSRAITPAVLNDVVVINYNDVDGAKALLEAEGDNLAAVLVDPLVSRMGYVAATHDYLRMLREVTDRLGAMLIFDEVYTLRIARGGMQAKLNVTPDLTAMGKIIGGCMPIGAVGGREDVLAVFDPSRGTPGLPHGGTYNANPLSMAAGYASMSLLTAEAYAHLDELGERARQGLREIIADAGADAQILGEGSVLAVIPTRNEIRNWRDFAVSEKRHDRLSAFHKRMLDEGVLVAPHGTFVLSTPMTHSDIDMMLDAAAKSIHVFDC